MDLRISKGEKAFHGTTQPSPYRQVNGDPGSAGGAVVKNPPAERSKVVRQEAVVLQPPFLPPPVSGSFVERPRALCWDRASGGSQPL